MSSHEELVAEMASLERMSVQERLKLARKRRAQQLKRWTANDREFTKRSRKSTVGKSAPDSPMKRRINFAPNIKLLEAAARGSIEEVRLLLESGVNPNIGNEDGLTALHQCCIDNNEAMMKLLVEYHADVNVTDRELWTPLHASSTCGHANLARLLVSKGAELLAINSDGNMPYDICEDEMTLDYIESQMAERGITQEQIDELRDVAPNRMLQELTKHKINNGDLDVTDEMGATYLHIAAANGYDKVAKFLLESNIDVNAKDGDGWQPIHAAACWAHGEMIQLLVQYGADLEAKTNNDETPLTICEDDDLKNLINQLKAEISAHRSLGNMLVRRNSSRNKRSSSIRRSSKREKGELRKLDARGEAMYIQSQGDDVPASNIDEVNVDLEEVPQSPASIPSSRADPENEEGGADNINGALETDIVPMPVITEELPESPDRRARLENGDSSVVRNGEQPGGLGAPGLQRQPKSILKKRRDQEAAEDPNPKKSRREKSKEAVEEERLKEREEREKTKQREREERQRKKEEKEREKQRIKEEKRLLRKRDKEEREKEKQQKRKTITDETAEKTEDAQTEDAQTEDKERDSNHSSGHIETLAELKRHRASEHAKRTHSGDSVEDYEAAYRKDSVDLLKDHKAQNSGKKKSPHIVRKILPHRLSGSYTFNEAAAAAAAAGAGLGDGHRDSAGSEQNGIGDQAGVGNASEARKTTLEPYPADPPLKRFTAIEPEVIGGDEDRRCCVIL